MRHLTVIVFILLMVCHFEVVSQPCLPDGITFTTQSQIDSFPINYPGCTEIEGDVIIEGPGNITNLNGLNVLTRFHANLLIYNLNNLTILDGLNNVEFIGGHFQLSDMDTLSSLSGLESVDTIGEFFYMGGGDGLPMLYSLSGLNSLQHIGEGFIIERTSITDFSGLGNLNSIGGRLEIDFNPDLINLFGLDSLSSVNGLSISRNNELSDLSHLQNLLYNGGEVTIDDNNSLTNLSGLNGLSSIEGMVLIRSNNSLTNLSGLENINSIGGELIISKNTALNDITDLDAINAESISELWINDNPLLSSCNVQSVCNYLANPNGIVSIFGNDTGCNSPVELASACSIDLHCLPYGNYYFFSQEQIDNFQSDYPNCEHLSGRVLISGENIANLNGLNTVNSINFLSIGYNSMLPNLMGFENLDTIGEGLSIYANDVLNDLSDVENLKCIHGSLYIEQNDSLVSLYGLDNIDTEFLTDLYIMNNPSLSICEVVSICEYLPSPNGYVAIVNNAPGCNSVEEVEDACTVGIFEQQSASNLSVYPNPFTTSTTIEYELTEPTHIQLTIYNHLGEAVEEAVSAFRLPGVHTYVWSAEGLSEGMYFAVLRSEEGVSVVKIVKH